MMGTIELLPFTEETRKRMAKRIQTLGLSGAVDEEHLERWWVAVCTWLVLLRKNIIYFSAFPLPTGIGAGSDGAPYDFELLIIKIRSFKDKLLWLLHTHYQIELEKKNGQVSTKLSRLLHSGQIPSSIRESISIDGILGVNYSSFKRLSETRNHVIHGLDLAFIEAPMIRYGNRAWEGYVNLWPYQEIRNILEFYRERLNLALHDLWQGALWDSIDSIPRENVKKIGTFQLADWLGGRGASGGRRDRELFC